MAGTADQIRAEIAALKKEMTQSIDDTHQTLYGEVKRLQTRVSLAEGQLRGRAKTARETVEQVFASGAYEATLNRMAAMERTLVHINRHLSEIDEKLAPDPVDEPDVYDEYDEFDDLD